MQRRRLSDRRLVVVGLASLAALLGCSSEPPRLPEAIAAGLPRDTAGLIELCSVSESEWADPRYQLRRRERLAQARRLAQAVRSHPDSLTYAETRDAHTLEISRLDLSVRDLAFRQIERYESARGCERPETATPVEAQRESAAAIQDVRRSVAGR